MYAFLVVITKTFLMRIYSSRLNILCYFFYAFVFWGTNIKSTMFSGRVCSHPSHHTQLRPWRLIYIYLHTYIYIYIYIHIYICIYISICICMYISVASQKKLPFVERFLHNFELILLQSAEAMARKPSTKYVF